MLKAIGRQIFTGAMLLAISFGAHANFHLWQINEIYSNADGSVQFIELSTTFSGQQLVAGHSMTSSQGGITNTFNITTNLPSDSINKTFLIGTQGFAALNLVAPDYIVPNGFLFTNGGTLNWGGGADIVTYASLPTDGRLSINRAGVTAINSPTNFGGITGSINAVTGKTRFDFDGDGKSDILWRNSATGDDYLFFMNGLAVTGEGYLPNAPTAWSVAGVGDFDGDGKADILWRNSSTGDTYFFLMDGLTIVSQGYGRNVPTAWSVGGVGDFDGDGKADILWRNGSTGDTYLFLMSGLTVTGEGYLPNVPTAWNIKGVGDFNGDGKADIHWRNSATGDTYFYLMNGLTIASQGYGRNVPVAWSVAGVGDFNGDGKADILWRNSSTGDDYIFLMNGLTIASEGYSRNVPSPWTVVGTGDYDGDGKADVLWRNACTGDDYLFPMDGLTVLAGEGYLRNVPSTWQVIAAVSPPSQALSAIAQRAYVKASNTGAGDSFGRSVALSADGSTLAVGAFGEASAATGIGGNQADNSASFAGAVYIFTRAGASWTQQAYIKASNTGVQYQFGVSVALSADGSTLAVGSSGEASAATGVGGNQADNSAFGAGAVYVFTRAGTTWSQEAYVKASNTGATEAFGASIALSADGSTLAVGAYGEPSAATGIDGNQADHSAGEAGAVYVFTRAGTTWTQQAYIKASNTDGGDFFGGSVALSADGSTLAVGAGSEDSAATGIDGNQADNSALDAGAVYVFTRAGTTWTQQAYVKASNTGGGDGFGVRVALSSDGSTLVVGAYGESSAATGIDGNQADNSASSAGAVYVFTRIGSTWIQEAYIKASNTGTNDFFGTSVSLSADGSTLVVGAWGESSAATGIGGNQVDNAAANAGAVYMFSRACTNWVQLAYVKASNTGAGDFFGIGIALSADGSTLAIGADGEDSAAIGIGGNQADNSATNAGAVYVFQ